MTNAPNLILITVDCLRADHVGFLGYRRNTTPFLDHLANESFTFRNAITPGVPTYYAVPAILASRNPLAFGRDLLGIAPDESTIASVLQDHGFASAAFVAANPYLSAKFGFDRGFETFCDFLQPASTGQDTDRRTLKGRVNRVLADVCHRNGVLGPIYDELYFRYCQSVVSRTGVSLDALRQFPSADTIVEHALAWLGRNSGQRFFMWLHFMDPHGPYFPKPEALEAMGEDPISAQGALSLNSEWNRSDLSAGRLRPKKNAVMSLYDAGIRWVDQHIQKLVKHLEDLKLWEQCVLAVTADHGEEFLEHDGRFHSPNKLTQELVHVPLLLRAPSNRRQTEILSPVSLVDLAPTLLDALSVPLPADFRGRSCWSDIRKNTEWNRPVFTECVHGCTNPYHPQSRVGPRILAVRLANHKLVLNFATGEELLYDLDRDPREHHPLLQDELPSVRGALLQHARKYVAESSQSRDFDRRLASQLRDFRLEWAHSAAHNSVH